MNMKTLIKSSLAKYAPRLLYAIAKFRCRHLWRQRYDFQDKIKEKLFARTELVVLSGPFKGMNHINDIVWGPITPKWLGTYECELHPVMFEIIRDQSYDTIVDVGAAEGYYAIGLARHLPKCIVFAFDLDYRARLQQRHLARLNKVNNAIVGSGCNHVQLENHIRKRCLVVCDIEGYEVQLLDPTAVPALKRTDVLVEVHSTQNMDAIEVKDLLIQRFFKTHEIETIDSQPRDLVNFRHLVPPSVTDEELAMSLDEGRNGPQCWLWMRHVAK
jgi:precorrin-6B methylase 2